MDATSVGFDVLLKRIGLSRRKNYAPADSLWWPLASAIPYWRIL